MFFKMPGDKWVILLNDTLEFHCWISLLHKWDIPMSILANGLLFVGIFDFRKVEFFSKRKWNNSYIFAIVCPVPMHDACHRFEMNA